jgi:hypothetical protein
MSLDMLLSLLSKRKSGSQTADRRRIRSSQPLLFLTALPARVNADRYRSANEHGQVPGKT